ncbi:MAG: exopolysaccharide production protein ExoY [Paracoccaceae bacterium]|jgi:lipopolysaccharide/colanic/teichoic acid biosynthesis glycosyltransferase
MTAHFTDVGETAEVVVLPEAAKPTTRKAGLYRNGLKRVFDLLLIVLSAPLVVPVIAILAVMVAMDGSRPFYRQERVGLGGRKFSILKLRTMVVNADAELENHLEQDAAARAEWVATQKLKNDPRVTKVGRLLRKTSLDELPQLWNVILGDMALVGPRPMMTEQQEMYPGTAYYTVRPGITGAWQISARNSCQFSGRARFDTKYAANVSFGNDVAILYRTISIVARGTGY